MRETWYVLEDGTPANPNDVAPDDSGRLVHKSGVPVAVGPHGPRSTGVDVQVPKKEAPPKKEASYDTREATSDKPKRTYKTRSSRSGGK